MFTHPDITGQLVREHPRQLLAAARQRQVRRQHGRRVSTAEATAGAAVRRLAPAVAEPSL
jgi:hypothetical protein